jgi:hypothetical protein
MKVPFGLNVSRWPRNPGLLCTTEEIAENSVERRGMFDHQSVGRPRQHGEFGCRNQICEFLAITPRGQDILIADDHSRRNIDQAELIAQCVIGGEDCLDLRGESM